MSRPLACMLLLAADVAVADDCAYYRENYQAYLATCAEHDCRHRQRMAEMVAAKCGDAAPVVPSPAARDADDAGLPFVTDAGDAYSGQPCRYFLAPTRGKYADGDYVCHADSMYECRGARWDLVGRCRAFLGWQDRLAEKLERSSPAPGESATPDSRQSPEACAALTGLDRDVLRRKWLAAVARLRLFADSRRELEATREALRRDMEFNTGQARQFLTYLAQTLRTSCNLLGNLLAFAPATATLAPTVFGVSEKTAELITRAGELSFAAWEQELEAFAMAVVLSHAAERSQVAIAVKTLVDWAGDIETLMELPADFSASRAVALEQIAIIDRQLARLRQRLEQDDIWLRSHEAALRGVRARCGVTTTPSVSLP